MSYRERNRKRFLWICLGVLVAIAVVAQTPPPGANNDRGDRPMQGDPEVRIDYFKWRAGGFSNVMIADFMVKNHNSFSVKDVEIRCHVSGQSGTVIGRPAKPFISGSRLTGSCGCPTKTWV